MAEHHERIGQHVGEYRLLRWLGGGGFGNVYLAEHVRDHSQVAIKVLTHRLSHPDELRSFLGEARMFRLQHPHIMPLLDFGLSRQDEPYLVMEYAPYGTLRDRHRRGSRVPLSPLVSYATQVAEALQYAHEHHVIHRDVKPENMLLRSNGTVLLSDFGIATTAHSTHSLSASAGIGGTMSYMAPEQLDGKPRPASDQYALAVVIYEWLTGRCPFVGTTVELVVQHATKAPPRLSELVSGIPDTVEAVLFKALAKDASERFASLHAFATALQQASALAPLLPPAGHPQADPSQDTCLPSTIASSVPPLALTRLPITQEPLHLPTQVNTETVASHGRHTPLPPTLQTVPSAWPNTVKSDLLSWRLPRRSSDLRPLLAVLEVLVIAPFALYAYFAMHTPRTEATATPAPTATGNATLTAYQTYTSGHGIMFGFDAKHTRSNPYEQSLKTATVSRLHLRWVAPTGAAIYSSPVVAGNLVYVGSDDHRLYAFDATTGKPAWTVLTGSYVGSSPAVAGNLVYVGSYDHTLYAFNAATGVQQWSARTGGKIGSSPTVAAGTLYIGSQDGNLYAFNATTGVLKWSAATTAAILDSSPAVAGGLVYVGSLDHKLYAFNATTGMPVWVASTGGALNSSPAVVSGLVYVGSADHRLYAFDATTGAPVWVASTGDYIGSSPAVAGSLVYIGSEDHFLYAFDAATGAPRWHAATGGLIDAAPTVAGGLVYVGSADQHLYAFDAATGEQKWVSPQLGARLSSSPTVADGMVSVGCKDGNLYAFSL